MKKLILMVLIIMVAVNIVYAENVEMAIQKLKNKETREEGVREIESIGVPSLSQLQDFAKDKNKAQEERITAIILMGKIGKNAPAQIQKVSKEPKIGIEQQAQISKSQVRILLQDILKNEQDKFFREASAISLGYLEDAEAIPKLKETLKDESGNVKMRAAWALAKLGDTSGKEPALQALTQKDVTAQLLAIDVLEELDDKSVIPQLQKNLNSDNVWTKIHSMLAIKRIEVKDLQGQTRLNYLQETLKDKQFEVNHWAAMELGKEVSHNTESRNKALEILKQTAKDNTIAGNYSAGKILRILLEKGNITENDLQ